MKANIRGEQIRDLILTAVDAYQEDISGHVAETLRITQEAVGEELEKLMLAGVLVAGGDARRPSYRCKVLTARSFFYEIVPGLERRRVVCK